MRGIIRFLRATVIGGVFFLAPLVVLIIVLNKAFEVAAKLIRPLTQRIPDFLGLGGAKEDIVATVILVFICFIAGLLARSAIANRFVEILERRLLSLIPGYDYIKLEGASALGVAEANALPVVLAWVGDFWQIGIKTETIGENWVAVFIPESPNPHGGAVFIVERANVRECPTPRAEALATLRRCGVGANWLAGTLEGWEARA